MKVYYRLKCSEVECCRLPPAERVPKADGPQASSCRRFRVTVLVLPAQVLAESQTQTPTPSPAASATPHKRVRKSKTAARLGYHRNDFILLIGSKFWTAPSDAAMFAGGIQSGLC
jgi:hypothetical protein